MQDKFSVFFIFFIYTDFLCDMQDLPFHSHNKNIMPLIPFSVPPHMEQPEAPLTAEEREKKIREQIEYYFRFLL